jgi:hypothetical protein
MFNIAPEPLDEDVIECSSPSIHADGNAFPFQHAYEGITREL